MPKEICLLFNLDSRYVGPFLVTLSSLLDSLEDGYALSIVVATPSTDPVDESDLRRRVDALPRSAVITKLHVLVVQVEDLAVALHASGHYSVATYLRLFAIERLPADVDYILYLDSDLLVMRRSIHRLWEERHRVSTVVAAVRDPDAPRLLARMNLLPGFELHDYFNAGVLIINVRRWKQERILERSIELLRKYRFDTHDQDVLNLVTGGIYHRLDRHWNETCRSWLEVISLALLAPIPLLRFVVGGGVFHYVSTPKPWHSEYRGLFLQAYRRLYVDRLGLPVLPAKPSPASQATATPQGSLLAERIRRLHAFAWRESQLPSSHPPEIWRAWATLWLRVFGACGKATEGDTEASGQPFGPSAEAFGGGRAGVGVLSGYASAARARVAAWSR